MVRGYVENFSQLLLLTSIVHSTDKTEKGNDRGPKARFQHLSFHSDLYEGSILNKKLSYDEEERKRL